MSKPKTTALAPWYGAFRMNAYRLEELFDDCSWVGIPFIRCLYPESDWSWITFNGRKQTNTNAPEVLIARN